MKTPKKFQQWMEERKKGQPLSESDPLFKRPGSKVTIYRACLEADDKFKHMDYVTRSYKFAREHADHTAAVEEEPAHVLRVRVLAAEVFEAYNPGEYFYGGPEVAGRTIYRIK